MSANDAKFKVGDRVRRIKNGLAACPIGFETDVAPRDPYSSTASHRLWYFDKEGDKVNSSPDNWEIVSTSPIRTVARREIVPGDYGYLRWSGSCDGEVTIDIDAQPYTAIDLREAAHLFNQLAEVLEENAAGEQKAAA